MRNNCSSVQPSSADGLLRFYHPDYGCVCDRKTHEREPGLCTLICPRKITDFSDLAECVCQDHFYAGRQCSQKVCQSRGKPYCLNGQVPSRCEGRVNYDGLHYWDYCPCVHGYLFRGECKCQRHYGGLFCQDHFPPSTTTTAAPDGSTQFGISINITLFISVSVFLIIVACAITFWQDRRRRRAILEAARWDITASPAVEPWISCSSVSSNQTADECPRIPSAAILAPEFPSVPKNIALASNRLKLVMSSSLPNGMFAMEDPDAFLRQPLRQEEDRAPG